MPVPRRAAVNHGSESRCVPRGQCLLQASGFVSRCNCDERQVTTCVRISKGYYDDNVYFNNPADYLPNLNDDYYLPILQKRDATSTFSPGQETTKRLIVARIFPTF